MADVRMSRARTRAFFSAGRNGGQLPGSYPSSLRSAYWPAGHRNQGFAPTSRPHVPVCRYTDENEGSMLLVPEAHFVPHLAVKQTPGRQRSRRTAFLCSAPPETAGPPPAP